MANEEHVKRLKEEVESWNAWSAGPWMNADLSGADLGGERVVRDLAVSQMAASPAPE